MYHQLHNVETYPAVLLRAEELLTTLLSEAVDAAQSRPGSGLLSLENYSEAALATFLRQQAERTDQRWLAYLERRKAGSPRELFNTREDAALWLRRRAPVKLVDGAWLGFVHGAATPFAQRPASKAAWQVLSEEYGDGNLAQHHVHMYRELLRQVGVSMPDAHDAAFVQPSGAEHDDVGAWQEGVAQLLISLFPHAFLAEILGFNMHYELVSLDTLTAAKELREVGIDPYYFTVHITVDNAHSGHTAIAARAVDMYIAQVREREGEHAAEAAWKRVRAGYLLSEYLASSSSSSPSPSPSPPSHGKPGEAGDAALSALEEEVVGIFEAKARVSQHVHCTSRLRFGGQPLADWLSPASFESALSRRRFLDDLAAKTPRRSRLTREMAWGGKMFGAFTRGEAEVVARWIDSLAEHTERGVCYGALATAARRERRSEDALRLTLPEGLLDACPPPPPFFDAVPATATTQAPSLSDLPLDVGNAQISDPDRFAALWFAHPCLLERFVAVPSRSADAFGCAIMRVLRAQHGFEHDAEDRQHAGVAGMDELRRGDTGASLGLAELGMAAVQQLGLEWWRDQAEEQQEPPSSLLEVLQGAARQRPEACRFAVGMVEASMRPVRNQGLLVGMALAFGGLFRGRNREALACMAAREMRELVDVCVPALLRRAGDCGSGGADQLWRGFEMARVEIESCFTGK
ncbi:hypothetical protein B0J12DRAFT_707858 [Macrophomina phaseolina]|uniref:Heme oxygenase-like protein n=1 Tax=Macrophomina phaseolina TaxID=35725 RepID=A0ABQ8GTR0_9PEZI|nr:hypothetical protein B0J12DRAFT_707858 [Macrophomina phaseolina]